MTLCEKVRAALEADDAVEERFATLERITHELSGGKLHPLIILAPRMAAALLAAEELERIGTAVWHKMPQNELAWEFMEALDALRTAMEDTQ